MSDDLTPREPVVFKLPTATVSATSESVSVAAGSNLWLTWAGIAIEEARVAQAARAVLRAQVDQGAPPDNIPAELRAVLKSIGAASFALDGLALYIESKLTPGAAPDKASVGTYLPAGERATRGDWVARWLEVGLGVDPVLTAAGPELHDLFALRNGAVHHRVLMKPPSVHPLGLNTTEDVATYTTELSDRYAKLLVSIVAVADAAPSPESGVAAELSHLRGALQGFLMEGDLPA
jgi:hypothetical protein